MFLFTFMFQWQQFLFLPLFIYVDKRLDAFHDFLLLNGFNNWLYALHYIIFNELRIPLKYG